MPIDSFEAFSRAMLRVRASDKTEDAWTNFVTSQGEHKNVQEWVQQVYHAPGTAKAETLPLAEILRRRQAAKSQKKD